jgi:hypothetical protein
LLSVSPVPLRALLCDPSSGDASIELIPDTTAFGFQERCTYKIPLPELGWLLVIDDEQVASTNGFWNWSPGFYAGLVQAELFDAGGISRGNFQIDVAPDDSKIGAIAFEDMIEDIWEFEPDLVLGTEPAQRSIGASGTATRPWIQYARIRAWSVPFLNALEAVGRKPQRNLKVSRAQLPPHGLRAADRTTVMTWLRNPRTLLMKSAAVSLRDASVDALFDVPVVTSNMDSAANRCLAYLVRSVAWRVLQLLQSLERAVARDTVSATRSPLVTRWPRRRAVLTEFHRRLIRIQRREFLRDVSRPELSAAGLTAISADPTYSAAYRLGWKIVRPGIEGLDRTERAWLSPTWEVYENWCFVEIAKRLRKRIPSLQKAPATSKATVATYALEGTDDHGRRIRLLLQPSFPAGDQPANAGLQSVSGQRYPDIALICESSENCASLILDAKYRTQRVGVLEGMGSAHVYRDALRVKGNAVDFALLLVPRGGGAPWLESVAFHESNRVGTIAFDSERHGHLLDAALNRTLQLELIPEISRK